MVCVTYSSTIHSIVISNFPLVFQILLLFDEIYVYMFELWNLLIKSTKKSDIIKTKVKLKIMRDVIVDYNAMHTMTGRIMKSVQWCLRNVNISYFS